MVKHPNEYTFNMFVQLKNEEVAPFWADRSAFNMFVQLKNEEVAPFWADRSASNMFVQLENEVQLKNEDA
jgi:hypothetical protein